MREIKFRAWSDKTKMFFVCAEDLESINHEIFVQNCMLMQYTGLLDKNGKEIYEGDIIRISEWTDRDGEIIKEEIGIVRWEDYTARFHSNMGQFIPHTSCEIIGNIYENPELLKAREA